MLTFCPTGSEEGSGEDNGTEVFSPGQPLECQTALHDLDANTLFFVLNNAILPDYEHNLTYSVSDNKGVASLQMCVDVFFNALIITYLHSLSDSCKDRGRQVWSVVT